MKKKILWGFLIILVVISTICIRVNSANVNRTISETKEEYITEDDLIYSNKYLVKGKTICRIEPKTSIEEFRKNIEIAEGQDIKIYKREKEITSGNIGTEMKIKGTNGEEYVTSVIGDITGDGIANQVELTMIIRHLINLKGWELEGIEKDAGDITGDGKINLVDITKLINYIVYGKWEKGEISTPKEPTITVISKKEENSDYYINEVKIKIEGEKEGKVTYKITGDKEQKETEIKEGETITIAGEGEYIVTAYSYGKEGNKSKGVNKVIKIKKVITGEVPVDKVAPTVNATVPTNWTKGNKTITVSGTDADSGIAGYYISTTNQAPSATATGWSTTTTYSRGLGTYYVWSKDNAGNVSTAKQVSVINIDTKAPTITKALNLPEQSESSISLNIEVADELSGISKIEWYYKKQAETTYTSEVPTAGSYTPIEGTATGNKSAIFSKTLTGLTLGTTYNIYAVVYDVAGNSTRSPETGTLNVSTHMWRNETTKKTYSSLSRAFLEVDDEETIKLLGDSSGVGGTLLQWAGPNESIYNRRVTLDLNQHSYTVSTPIYIQGFNSLTVTGDGTLCSTGGISMFGSSNSPGGYLYIENGTYSSDGCVFRSGDYCRSYVCVKGGNFTHTSRSSAFDMRIGRMEMTGGKIDSAGIGVHIDGGGKFIMTGGSIRSDDISVYATANEKDSEITVEISGTSTVVESGSYQSGTIRFAYGSSGILTIGSEGSSSSDFPYIKNRRVGWGIETRGAEVTINKYSGKVD